MSKLGPIVVIEDDEDDRQLFMSAVRDLNIENAIEWFPETAPAMDFLINTPASVFLIFCDINLPGDNGLDFKRHIDRNPELRRKSIPFIFYSTAAKRADINEAYMEMAVQGFFKKDHSYSQMKETLRMIFDYWLRCLHPNTQ